jgi:hypothetical protein
MRVSDQQIFDLVALYTLGEKMVICIGRKIDKKVIVYERLRASADVFASESPCFVAVFAVTENSGEAFSRRRAEIFELHLLAPLLLIA